MLKVGQITEPGEEGHPINTYGVAVDPTGKDLYVLDEPGSFVPARVQLQRYVVGCAMPFKGSGCTAAETFTNSHLTAEFAEGHGLAVGPGEEEPVYVTSRERGEVRVFSVVTVPGVVTGKPSGLSSSGATLEGSVDAAGVALKECFFEYGETEAYGHSVACEHPDAGEVPVDSARTRGARGDRGFGGG